MISNLLILIQQHNIDIWLVKSIYKTSLEPKASKSSWPSRNIPYAFPIEFIF